MSITKRALIIGTQAQLLHSLPNLLSRAGFIVDLMTNSFGVKHQKTIRYLLRFKSLSKLIHALFATNLEDYALIVCSDDDTLTAIQMSYLPENKKIKLLPIVAMANAFHLHSKIALSQILHANHIPTPQFAIAKNPSDLQNQVINIGYPVMIKVDQSGGGFGVYSCENADEFKKLGNLQLQYPLLIQKKVSGKLADLSGFYQNGKLIHFTYSEFEKTIHGKYGPSVLRTYYDSADLPPQIKVELEQIGKALGIHGFTNLSCIMSTQREYRHYIEVDLRPTVWCDYGKYLNDDPAIAIKSYFDKDITGISPAQSPLTRGHQDPQRIAHYLRLNLFELLCNRYGIWRYLDGASLSLFAQQCLIRQPLEGIEYWLTCAIKTKLPPGLWQTIRSQYLGIKARFL